MNKKGFTLVELLAVIVIIGVLLTIATLSVIGVMNNAKKDVGEFTKKQITDAATTYALDEKFNGTLTGDNIVTKLTPYYPEIGEKCTIGNGSSVKINNTDEDIIVTVSEDIKCEK